MHWWRETEECGVQGDKDRQEKEWETGGPSCRGFQATKALRATESADCVYETQVDQLPNL